MKKATIFSMYIFLLIFIASCNLNNAIKPDVVPIENGVSIESCTGQDIFEKGIDKLSLCIHNGSEGEIEYGEFYSIEYWKNNIWNEVKLEGVAWNDLLNILLSNDTRDHDIFLYPEIHKYKAGIYRITIIYNLEGKVYKMYYHFELK